MSANLHTSPPKWRSSILFIPASVILPFTIEWEIDLKGQVWAFYLLLFAAIAVVPLSSIVLNRQLQDDWLRRNLTAVAWLHLPCVLLLYISFIDNWNNIGAYLSPLGGAWLILTLIFMRAGIGRIVRRGRSHPPPELCIDAGLIYIAVGGIWTLFTAMGIRPLNFNIDIVLLTGVHFHYAGFALPILAGLAARRIGGKFANETCWWVIAGVPLTAIGITATQLQWHRMIETLAALAMAGAGLATARLYFLLVPSPGIARVARGLWLVAAVSLIFGMVLAAMYGLRFLVAVPWLNIPWMRALHGSANAFGFAFCGLLGWFFLKGKETK